MPRGSAGLRRPLGSSIVAKPNSQFPMPTDAPKLSAQTALETKTAPAPDEDQFATKLRGFGPVGVIAALLVIGLGPVFEPFGAMLAPLWVWRSRTPWREIGYVAPKSWTKLIAAGIVFGSLFKLLMKAVVMPLLGASPINQAYHYLAGNRAALPGMIFAIVVGAGWGEETVFRGFAFERLGKLFGKTPGAKATIVVLTSAWFGFLHYPVQGLSGAEQAAIVGVVFGTIFAIQKQIFFLMVAHAAFDLTALAMIYFDAETRVAHLLFR
jgi:uncharacterized protein